jgi:membrane associated rhomboid family serine protease
MGIYDRDYYQRKSLPRGGFGYFSAWSVTTWLIVLNIVVFLVGRNLARFGASPKLDELFGSIDADSAEGFRRLVLGMMNPIEPWQPLIGASAGVFGLLVASAMIAPDAEVFSIVMPVTVGMLAIAGLLLAAYAVFESVYAMNAGGPQAAHLGGGVLGLLLMKNQHWLNVFERGKHRSVPVGAGRRGRAGASRKDWSRDFNR